MNDKFNLEDFKKELERKNKSFIEIVQPYIEESENYRDYFIQAQNNLKNLKEAKYKICIVGTMKAGKSTTINAIIGEEIAPSREEAMTYLPTLIIRSNNDSKILNIKNTEALNEIIKEIKNKSSAVDRSELIALFRKTKALIKQDSTTSYLESKNSKEFVRDIAQGFNFKKQYTQDDKDFTKAMFYLNDIFRLANELNIETNWDKFSNANDLPDIKIEFNTLKDLEFSDITDFCLIDTPGPNEAGASTVLKNIFKEQIRDSNAVICIIDNSQKETEASKEVEKEILEILNIKNKNVFIFINKFDDNPSQNTKARTTEENYANAFSIPKENVFAISAKDAFFTQLGLNQIRNNGEANGYILEEYIGKRWTKFTVEEHKEDLEKAYEESNFANAINKAIIQTYKNSSQDFIQDEAKNLIELCIKANQNFNQKLNSLQKPLEDLQSKLKDLELSTQQLSNDIKKVKNEVENSKEIREKIDVIFNKSKSIDSKDLTLTILKNYPQLNRNENFKNNWYGAMALINNIQRDIILDLSQKFKIYSNEFEKDLQAYIEKINIIIAKELKISLNKVREILNKGSNKTIISLSTPIFQAKDLQDAIKFSEVDIKKLTKLKIKKELGVPQKDFFLLVLPLVMQIGEKMKLNIMI